MSKAERAEMEAKLVELEKTYRAAKEQQAKLRTPETMDAVKVAWAEMSALAVKLHPQKVSSYASRAGKRQWAETFGQAARRSR